MKITNQHNLPNALVNAAQQIDDDYRIARGNADYTITELVAPPQLTILRRRYDDQLSEDISDRIWSIFGSAVHYLVAAAGKRLPSEIREERLSAHFAVDSQAFCISGALDNLRLEGGILTDYKVTSTYAVEEGPKPEWIAQLNFLRVLLTRNGYKDPERLVNGLFLRDHLNARTASKDYPQRPYLELEVPKWDLDEAEAQLRARLEILVRARYEHDDDLPPCTPSERWAKPDVWAVKRQGGHRALPKGLHHSLEQAQAFAATRGHKTEIEFREGENTRCERYCPVRALCAQHNQSQQEVAA